MSNNGRKNDPVEQMLQAIAARREALESEIVEQRKVLGALLEEETRLDRILRAAEPPKPREEPVAKQARKNRAKVAEWREDQVSKLLEQNDVPLTGPEIASALRWNTATTHVALRQMREKGLVRFAGHGKSNAMLWALMPN